MRLYNSLTQRIEEWAPQGSEVSLYLCGITPYATTHLGHAFTYAVFDVLVRYLEFAGYRVKYVQNVTDIDDDMLRESRKVGEDWWSLGVRWTTRYIQDMRALNIRPPNHFPRASEAIPQIIAEVERLLAAGVAYESDGSVYFSIDAYPPYGQLSRLPREEMLPIANERGNFPDDPHKRDPLDFVLWQAQQAPDEPAWPSPWGLGRPGWHIECSTLVRVYLAETIDIHGGGADLAFPHHESEMAQAACSIPPSKSESGPPLARLWMHTAMLRHRGQKMSKSLGNLVMVEELLERYPLDALRLYLSVHHYRQPWDHDLGFLQRCVERAQRLRRAATARGGHHAPLAFDEYRRRFVMALEDDLDMPRAIAALLELAEELIAAAEAGGEVSQGQGALRELGAILGLRLDVPGPEARAVAGWEAHLQTIREKRLEHR